MHVSKRLFIDFISNVNACSRASLKIGAQQFLAEWPPSVAGSLDKRGKRHAPHLWDDGQGKSTIKVKTIIRFQWFKSAHHDLVNKLAITLKKAVTLNQRRCLLAKYTYMSPSNLFQWSSLALQVNNSLAWLDNSQNFHIS
ncbi:hypothetical protein VP01_3326g3 [Puccinia sorghi]|uniref:Uncharacterized protein n=1 Tax=Puccinia sorghi TaxID=27349 RepID=A0A0L6UXB4_9BASI|nr:hypothetical protein VP01_3326g3 [Puccinia sorghi]